jgi:phosphatidylserine/phosphatidylglycerophosphate/cardiolipin synthase-like enzyme
MMEAAQSAAHKGTVDPDLVVSSGNQVLAADIEAPRIFPAMAEMIVRARKSVALELFHWETGTDASRVLLQALRRLEQKQVGCAQPVAVRILVNDHRLRGGRDKAGLERDIQELDLDPRRVRVYTAAHSHTGLGVHHSKLLVIDGQELFLTGANVQEAYDFNNTWYDRGFHFKGPVAHAGRSEFDEAWDKCGGQPSAAAFGPVPAAPRAGDVAMLTASRPANGYLMASGQGYPTDQMFLAAFQLAQQRISVQSPNLNEPAVIDALVDAALRGVHVRIVLSKGFNKWAERVPGLGGANVDTVKLLKDRLARRGLFRWPMGGTLEVRWYSHDGLEPVEGGTDHASHCKYTSIDGSVFCCGSSNMDSFSATYAREFNSVVDSRQETVRADHLFYRVWRRSRPCYRWPH